MIAADYFAGAGGASRGLHDAGYDVIGYDHWSTAVDSHNANGLPAILLDLADPADTADDRLFPMPDCLDQLDQTADLAWFSPPCQPFSLRDGFPWAVRILAHTRPAVAIFENVRGLTFRKHSGYFAAVLDAIIGVGYRIEWRILNAADYGIPQTRERCFIVARRDAGPIVWPTPTHSATGDNGLARWVSMAADGWVFHGTKTEQARQVGNAVPATLARLLATANRPVTA